MFGPPSVDEDDRDPALDQGAEPLLHPHPTEVAGDPPGFRGEARQLRGDLPGSPRVQPGFSTLKDNRLTVILVG